MRKLTAYLLTDRSFNPLIVRITCWLCLIVHIEFLFLSLHLLLIFRMAPGLTDVRPSTSSTAQNRPWKDIFPDGIKTSGQHSPVYKDLRPYEEFPEEINGPTLWKAEDYKDNPERWTHYFTEKEIAELSEAADDFKAAGIPLIGISKVGQMKSTDNSKLNSM